MTYSYDNKHTAERIARKKNKIEGKIVWAVIEENDEWVVMHISELLTDSTPKQLLKTLSK